MESELWSGHKAQGELQSRIDPAVLQQQRDQCRDFLAQGIAALPDGWLLPGEPPKQESFFDDVG